jgi:hypothetical protein
MCWLVLMLPPVAEAEFAAGVAARADAVQARVHLLRAVDAWRKLAEAGTSSPSELVNWGHAAWLADDGPQALAAYAAAWRRVPGDPLIRLAWTTARQSVRVSADSELAPPRALQTWWQWARPRWPWFQALVVGLSATVGAAMLLRWWQTAQSRWGYAASASVLLAAVLSAGPLLAESERQAWQTPVAVVRAPVALRTGNGLSYPPRLAAPLPAGWEVRPLAQRGTWLQVEVRTHTGVAVGWLPMGQVWLVG